MTVPYAVEAFTPDERAILERHFTNLDGPVFALTNLPEVVKGALFARYSRTKKSLRRLFLDEFAEDVRRDRRADARGSKRARSSCTSASSWSTATTRWRSSAASTWRASRRRSCCAKALEWGRLAAYLEQSTRYMRYDDRPGGPGARRCRPRSPARRSSRGSERTSTTVFGRTGGCTNRWSAFYRDRFPKDDRGLRLRLPLDDHGEDLRHAADAAAGRRPGRTWGSTRPGSRTNSC